MAIEIERKFLLSAIPQGVAVEEEQTLTQGYLQLDDQKDLRIRRSHKGCTLTAKVGVGLVREENEHDIEEELFNTLWPFTEGRRITKVRYRIEVHDHPCDIDVYQGSLKGLIVMEAEFATEAAAQQFIVPAFCIAEITGDHRYRNAELAQIGMPDY